MDSSPKTIPGVPDKKVLTTNSTITSALAKALTAFIVIPSLYFMGLVDKPYLRCYYGIIRR
jgi:hypothetical protein